MRDEISLPPNWALASFEDIYGLNYGKALPKQVRGDGGSYPVLGSSGVVGSHTEYLVTGPVLIVGRKGSAGAVWYTQENCWPIDTTYFVKPPDGIDLRFAYYHLRALQLSQFEKSTAVPGLSRDDAYALRIAIPPTREQRRIVAKIEELFSEIDKGVEVLNVAGQQLKAYRQAVLKHAFDGKMTTLWRKKHASKQWVSLSIAEASVRIVDCLHSTPKFSDAGQYCIDSTWIEDNKVLFDQARFVDQSTYTDRITRLKPQRGDVLFVREGSKKIGTALVVNFDDDFCLGQRMMMFRLREDILPQYFVYYVQSDNFKKQYKPLIGGSASPHLNITDIKRMVLPLCSLAEQREIVETVAAHFSVIDDTAAIIDAEIDRSLALTHAILKKAFSGQLVPQDPTDEPASGLLDRIRAERGEQISPRRRNHKNGKKEAA